MANLDFNVDKIMKQVVSDSLDHIKKQFTADINRLAAPYGEHPRITFRPKGSNSLDVTFEVKSTELREKIDAYLKHS